VRPDCEEAVEQALGRSLRAGESAKIEKAINWHMRHLGEKDPAEWQSLSQPERLQRAAVAAAEDMVAEVQKKQQQVRLQIAVHDRIESQLVDAFMQLPADVKPGEHLRAVSGLLAFDVKGKGMPSAESWGRSVEMNALGRLMPLWNSVKGVAALFESQKGVSDLVHELYGEHTGNATAKAAADAWRTVTEELRQRANAAGDNIGKLDDWGKPQNHSQGRVAKVGLEKWTEATMPLLDRDKYLNEDGTRFSDDQMRNFLRHSYDTIITDGLNKREPGESGSRQQAAGIGRRGNAHRQIFFKDADSHLSYTGQFGDRSLWPTLQGHIRSIARDIGMLETLGPNPEQTFHYFNDRTHLDENRMFPESKSKVDAAASFNRALLDYVGGHQEVVNQRVADVGQSFRNFETATKLGRVAITALGDEAGMAATALANRIPYTQVLSREMAYLSPGRAEDRAVAAHTGLGINTVMQGMNRFGYEDLQLTDGRGIPAAMRQFTGKLASGVMHLSGAEAMWDARRRAMGSVLMSYIGKWTRELDHFADLNQSDHGVLATKGITENDWQVWKAAQPEDWGMKHGVLTPQSVYDVPDEKIAHLGDPDALRRHAATNLLGHVLEEVGMGVMDTGARERAGMFLGTQAGTAAGELTRSAFLFKSFGFSMMKKHWARAGQMPTATDKANYAARIIVGGMAMGAVANQLRNLVFGKDPENIASPKFWGSALLRGGGFGFYGDFLYDETTGHDTTLIPALAGPVDTELEQFWNLTGAAAIKHARGERTDEGAKLIRWARSEIPFLNMWYTQAAMDHLLWNDMQEAASPGYLDRMQIKANQDKGTSWYWDPHDRLPSRAPDFSLQHIWDTQRGAEETSKIADTLGMGETP
jgi:hypothetical protein